MDPCENTTNSSIRIKSQVIKTMGKREKLGGSIRLTTNEDWHISLSLCFLPHLFARVTQFLFLLYGLFVCLYLWKKHWLWQIHGITNVHRPRNKSSINANFVYTIVSFEHYLTTFFSVSMCTCLLSYLAFG